MVMATEQEYIAKPGSRLSQRDARIVGPELQRLADEQGASLPGLAPVDVVEAARAEHSPLHPYFEWKDSVAANQYRLEQARHLTRSIEIRIAPAISTRAFVSIELKNPASDKDSASDEDSEETKEIRYIPVSDVMTNSEFTNQKIEQFKKIIQRWREDIRVYTMFPAFTARFSRVIEAIDSLEAADPD